MRKTHSRLINSDAAGQGKTVWVNPIQLNLSYQQYGKKRIFQLPGKGSDEIAVNMDLAGLKDRGSVVVLSLNCLQEQSIELLNFNLELRVNTAHESKMMVNGFQTWSRSEEMGAEDRIKPLLLLSRPLLTPYGDYKFYRYSGRNGHLHSWTYTYFRDPDDTCVFIGSMGENAGYSLFEYDYSSNRFMIRKDCEGAIASTGYKLLYLYIGNGNITTLMEEYFDLLGSTRPKSPRATGWCSWYNYYTSVSEAIVRDNLKKLFDHKLPLDYFQIDDGWQRAVGDWLECNDKFPSGMKAICDEIKAHQFKPGLWLSPFICVRSSRLFREKGDWLLRDRQGSPVKAGFNPGWEGFFYALDFYASGFQDYLRQVLETIQSQWGFTMLKLDFLYAAALLPRRGKSRGQVMTEVIDFIDQHTRNIVILGCGVPLGPVFGRVDYCRIGSDVGPYWEDYLKKVQYRERVSTENSLVCTIGRQQLDQKAFRNDPDVFILRDGVPKINENRLGINQRHTLFFLNNLLGGLVFLSDDVAEYTTAQLQLLRSSFPGLETKITSYTRDAHLYRFEFTVEDKSYLAYANLGSFSVKIKLPHARHFHPELFVLQPGSSVQLEPYQSICFFRIEACEGNAYLLGSSGHIYPGAQIEKLLPGSGAAALKLHKDASPETVIYLALPGGLENFSVNSQVYPAVSTPALNYIIIPFSKLIQNQ
ncbi:MAG TPA: glycoside hydrolase family 36 protein [Candidatus Limnocylindrales bacterium]|nr:glycoside hydrolase family 36 protein [Candidatus Limnocylindrales bacterium]